MAEITVEEARRMTKSLCVSLGREARAAGWKRAAFRSRGFQKLTLKELGDDGRPKVELAAVKIPFSNPMPPFHSGVGLVAGGEEHEWFLEGMGEG